MPAGDPARRPQPASGWLPEAWLPATGLEGDPAVAAAQARPSCATISPLRALAPPHRDLNAAPVGPDRRSRGSSGSGRRRGPRFRRSLDRSARTREVRPSRFDPDQCARGAICDVVLVRSEHQEKPTALDRFDGPRRLPFSSARFFFAASPSRPRVKIADKTSVIDG